jgi:branched-chain amino acid transport system permease protein
MGAAAFAAAALVLAAPPYYVHLATLAVISAVLASSLNLLVGHLGLTSFGHAGFFGTAAYAAGIVALRHGGGFWLAAGCGLAAALALGLVFGLLASRSRGVYFLLITMALGQVVWGLAYRWTSLTGGDNGLPGVPRPALSLIWPMSDVRGYYLFVLLVGGAAMALMARVAASPFGYAMRGIRESESRMRTLGYAVGGYTYAAFVLSGVFAGVAGILYVFYNGFVSPADLHLSVSAQAVLMVILGGAGTVGGPIAGATTIVLLQNLLSSATRRWMGVLGLIFILVVLYAPDGLAGIARAWGARRGEAAPRPEGSA